MTELLAHVAFAVGGGLGAMARHGLSMAVTHRFPLATLLVNIVGSFALGAAVAIITAQSVSDGWEQAAFGFCGGFTTFSSFAYQTLDLHRQETFVHVAANILLSLVLCLAAFWLGGALV